MISNFIKQAVLNTGTGAIQLGDAITGFSETGDVFTDGSYLFYCLVKGTDKEIGVGQYSSASNSISRVKIFENIINGILVSPASTPLSIDTNTVFYLGNSAQAQNVCISSWNSLNVPLVFSNTLKIGNLSFGALDVEIDECLGNIATSSLTKVGGNLKLSFIVSNSINEVNNVKLSLFHSYGAVTSTLTETNTTTVISTVAQTNSRRKVTFDLGNVGVRDGSLAFNLKRAASDPSDTYSGALYIHSALLEYETDKLVAFNDLANLDAWE